MSDFDTIQKTVIEVTIFHRKSDAIHDWNLEQIIGEMNEGCFVGGYEMLPSTDVPAEKVREELLAIGNDGKFFEGERQEFDYLDDEPDRDRFDACSYILWRYDWHRIGGLHDRTGWTHIGDEAWVDVMLGQDLRFTHRLVIEFESGTHTVIRVELIGPPVGV